MTAEQKSWLDSNKPYRAIGQVSGFSRYVRRGMLYPDGTFELTIRGQRPRVVQGCFEVGILENKIPGEAERR
jgi:hypothetical protein